MFGQPADHECCAGAGWVRQRMAASYRAQHDYVSQYIQQVGPGRGAALQLAAQCACLPSPTHLHGEFAALLPCAWPRALHPPPAHTAVPCPGPLPQLNEEYAAAQARRRAALVAQPTLRLNLPEALQHPPPRLDLCSECAGKIEQVRRMGASMLPAAMVWRACGSGLVVQPRVQLDLLVRCRQGSCCACRYFWLRW